MSIYDKHPGAPVEFTAKIPCKVEPDVFAALTRETEDMFAAFIAEGVARAKRESRTLAVELEGVVIGYIHADGRVEYTREAVVL